MTMKNIFIVACLTVLTAGCETDQAKKNKVKKNNKKEVCKDSCCAEKHKKDAVIACKLTSPELQKRKETVLASLRKQVVTKKELPNGYAFTFKGTDQMLDELTEFIKTERSCCDFFTFDLSVKGDQSEIVLKITGVKEAKEFIISELEL